MNAATMLRVLFANVLPVLLGAVFLAATNLGHAQSPTAATPMEKQVLFGPDSAKKWSQAESTLEASTARTRSSTPTLHWHVTVDHTAGEPKYPIGWPRVSQNIPAGELRDWSQWDFLHFWVFTDTSRADLPREPVGLGLHTPDRSSAFHRPLPELKKGQWIEFTIPVAQIAQPADVRMIQFHIAESNYRHQDTLDLYIDDLALLRYAQPTLLEFSAERAVMFEDAKLIPAHFRLAGVKSGTSIEVACELRRQGQMAARTTVMASRGAQRALLDVSYARLQPGDYELVARAAGAAQSATAKVRLVESPWK